MFEDIRLRKIGNHLIYIERPHLLTEPMRQEHDYAHKTRILTVDPEAPWLTMKKAKQELIELLGSCEEIDKQFYQEHLTFIEHKIQAASLIV